MKSIDEPGIERILTRLLLHYARAVDRRDYEAIARCYWDDARDEHGSFSGNAPDYVAWLREVLPNVAVSSHQFTNILVDVESANAATSETYCFNVNVFAATAESPATHTTSLLRYLDRFERRDGEWRIVHRRVVTDWSRAETGPVSYR